MPKLTREQVAGTYRLRTAGGWALLAGVATVVALGPLLAQQRVAPPGYKTPWVNKVGGQDCDNATPVNDSVNPLSISFSDSDTSCGAPALASAYANENCSSFAYPVPSRSMNWPCVRRMTSPSP